MAPLDERQAELVQILVSLAEEGGAFEIPAGADAIDEPRWPSGVRKANRDEVRALVAADYLQIDRSAPPGGWRFLPTDKARRESGSDSTRARAEALKDPDERLGIILDAIVTAFEQDPSQPLMIFRTDQVDIVRHVHWPIEQDVVRMHDLRQLEHLELIGWDGTTEFFPTPRGRMAARNPAALLAQLADEVMDEAEQSRLRRAAEKFRAGDIAVSTAGGVTGAVIRAILGL